MKKELVLDTEKIHDLRYHVVLRTKDGRPLFSDDKLRQAVEDGCKASAEDTEGCVMTEYHVSSNELHMVLENAPRIPMNIHVDSIKDAIDKMIRESFEGLQKNTYGKECSVWAPGYHIATLGTKEEERLYQMHELWRKNPKQPHIAEDEFFTDIRRNKR